MTEEKMAKEYAKPWKASLAYVSVKEAYLAGLKAGRPKWHDLRKDPNDLPKPNIAVLICFQFEKWTTTYIAYYRPAVKKWQMYNLHEAQRSCKEEDIIDGEEVIAWCEIPQYTEE